MRALRRNSILAPLALLLVLTAGPAARAQQGPPPADGLVHVFGARLHAAF
jgi:hypothetical protein